MALVEEREREYRLELLTVSINRFYSRTFKTLKILHLVYSIL